jgi:hypothetical protein
VKTDRALAATCQAEAVPLSGPASGFGNGKLAVARGLISRRAEEAAPFLTAELASNKK